MKLKKNYVLPEIFANLIQYGIPLGYTVWAYDVFGGNEVVKQITGGTIVFATILWFFIKDKIKKFVNDYNTNLGEVAQKGKFGITFASITVVLMLAQFWIQGAIWFFGVVAVSNLASLPIYSISRSREIKYKELKTYIKNKELDETYKKSIAI
jgi:hypothetical protein